jgi:outer membrane receptor protein involved in Fe transport
MKLYLLKNILFSSILFLCFTASAQQAPAVSGSITGKLIDAANSQPAGFATISVIRKIDNQAVTGVQTDMDGNFNITGIADGIYMIKASLVGYLTLTRDSLIIRPGKRTIQFGALKIRQSKGVLKEVTVSAQRSQMKIGIDKKSFDVSQSLVSQGGSATDLLTNVPSVQVDVDGNVSLRGSTNVKVLINGKESTLTGSNLSDILQSIPASSIETIEVITNPSSKYDAEGQSGIINIVLKRNAQLGFTGSASAGIGNNNTYNGMLNLAYQGKKINIYGNYSYRKATRIGNGFTDKVSSSNGATESSTQVSDQKFTFGGNNIRSGIDFFLDPKNTLSFSDNINLRTNDRTQTGGTNLIDRGRPETISQNNFSHSAGTNLDFNLDFDHKFKKKQEELTANIGYSHDNNNHYDYLNSVYAYHNPDSISNVVQNNITPGKQRNINIQADYTLPLTNGKFETGYRSIFKQNDDNYIVDTLNNGSGVLDFSPLLSNHFIYKQNVNAAYANYQHQFGNFSLQGGLRLEDTHIRTELTQTNISQFNKQDYFKFYPSVFLTQKLSENQTLQLSYSRRISRPNDRQLSPFLDVSNRLSYNQGNPNLLPEDTHSFELSYVNYWKALTLTSSVYYRLTNDNIQQIVTPFTPGNLDTTINRFENIKSASNAGYELIAKVSPTSAIDITGNVNVYYRHIDGDALLGLTTTSGYSWNGNLTASIKPIKKLGIQLRGDYQGKQVVPQGYMNAMYGMDGGIRFDATKKLSFGLNSRDIFNTRKYTSVIMLNNQDVITDQTSQRRFSNRTISFNVTFRFGTTAQDRMNRQKDRSKDDNMHQKDPNNPDQDPEDDNSNQNNNNGNGNGGKTGGGPAGVKGTGSKAAVI